MSIKLTEPATSQYIYIDSDMNIVHLLVPLETRALKHFFDGFAVHELCHYISTLTLDIALLDPSDPQRTDKQERLAQIEDYMKAVVQMRDSYGHAISALQASSPLAETRYVTYHQATCVNFADIIDPTAAAHNPDYFERVRLVFACSPDTIPDKNESIENGSADVNIERLVLGLNNQQFELLSPSVKDACRDHPAFEARLFLYSVAKAMPDETDIIRLIRTQAEAILLAAAPADKQTLLRTSGVFTDDEDRTFNCTAYEYAYWAKDTHMCRMLESHMDEETKAIMRARIDEIEHIDATTGQPVGLVYSQAGEEHRSAHFDFTPLKEAYQRYIDGFDGWFDPQNQEAFSSAVWNMIKELRNVPAHVAQEYCRRSYFDESSEFDEETLPRAFIYQDMPWRTPHNQNFLHRPSLLSDFAAFCHLDVVRTDDLTLSREHLNPPAAPQGMTI